MNPAAWIFRIATCWVAFAFIALCHSAYAEDLVFGNTVEQVHPDEVELVKYLRKVGIGYNLNNRASNPNGEPIVETDRGRVISLFMYVDKRLTTEDMQPLLAATELSSFDCPAWADDRYLEFFCQRGRFPKLHHIEIRDSKITDQGLIGLKNLAKLRVMNIRSRMITDDGVQALSQIPKLDFLRLHASRVSDRGLTYLMDAKNLDHLELNNTQVTDEGLRSLGQIGSLQTLYLDNTQVTGAGLNELSGLRELKMLSLNDTPFNDQGLLQLAEQRNLTQLSVLYLANTKITDAGCVAFEKLNNLSVLTIRDTAVTDEGIRHINNMPKLYNLELSRHVTQAGRKWLGENAVFAEPMLQTFRRASNSRPQPNPTPASKEAMQLLEKRRLTQNRRNELIELIGKAEIRSPLNGTWYTPQNSITVEPEVRERIYSYFGHEDKELQRLACKAIVVIDDKLTTKCDALVETLSSQNASTRTLFRRSSISPPVRLWANWLPNSRWIALS